MPLSAMLDLATQFTEWALRNARVRALLFGGSLGWLTWGLSMVPERTSFSFAMALLMLASGTASFVFHAMHEMQLRGGMAREARGAELRRCLCLLGAGVGVTLLALQALYP